METSLCGGSPPPCTNEISPVPATAAAAGRERSKLSGGTMAGIVIGLVAVVLLLLILFLFLLRNSGWSKNRAAAKPLEVAAAADKKHEYDLEDLLRASAEVLGKGTFGMVYKAELEDGTVVAVRRLSDVISPEEEFREKVEAVVGMKHENIVPLRAYHYSRNEKLLVYDYMPMGSLSALLHGNKRKGRTLLNWETRLSIALSVACGIDYIHSISPTTIHGNIKSRNILFNKSLNACVSDNGLVSLVDPSSSPRHVSGYQAPEVAGFRKVSQKADVYSFGVLLLELLTGKAPEDGVLLPRLVQSVLQEEWSTDILDLELFGQQNVEEMVQLLQLGMNCTVQYPDSRPSMSEVRAHIELIVSLSRDDVEVQEQQLLVEPSGREAVSDQCL